MSLQFNANFRIDGKTWKSFIQKYRGKASERLRQLIRSDLEASEEILRINRNDVETLKNTILVNSNPIQIIGRVNVGKTTCVKKLIANDSSHIFIVLDAHDEYYLPEIQTITTDLKQSSRIRMPKQISASRGLYPVYHNQILSQKWPDNYVIVIEEAHRYLQIKELLKEARKFVKIIAISQEPLGNFCPTIEIMR